MSPEDVRPDIDRARAGDREAFGRLVQRYQRRVYVVAYRMTGSDDEARDVAQEAFIRAFRAMDRFDGRCSFFTWIYRIVVNTALNHIRRRGRRAELPLEEVSLPPPLARHAGDDPGRALELSRVMRAVHEAMDTLSDSLRAALVLVVLEEMSYREASEVLECSPGTVGWRVHEARQKLRERLGRDELVLRMLPQLGAADAREGGAGHG